MENFSQFFTLYGYQKSFVSYFFPICPIATKLWHKVQLGTDKKKRVVNEPSIFDRKKVIEFESWILTHFQAKNRSNFTFQTQ